VLSGHSPEATLREGEHLDGKARGGVGREQRREAGVCRDELDSAVGVEVFQAISGVAPIALAMHVGGAVPEQGLGLRAAVCSAREEIDQHLRLTLALEVDHLHRRLIGATAEGADLVAAADTCRLVVGQRPVASDGDADIPDEEVAVRQLREGERGADRPLSRGLHAGQRR
jgi:hypothetical protein